MSLLDNLVAERAEITAQQNGIMERAADNARDLSDAENTNLSDLAERAAVLDERIAGLREIAESNAKAAETRAELATATATADTPAATGGNVTVRHEPLTYDQGSPENFFRDLFRSTVDHDPAAAERLARHQTEMRSIGADTEDRSSDTSNFAGLVVPQYLTDLSAPLARAGRPFANICRRLPLPADGLTLNISRLTTGSSSAAQASENAAVSETDPDDTLLTVNVRTYAGKVDLSRQAIDRGTGTDQLVAQDMAMAYATSLNADLINGAGTSGTHLGVLQTSGINDIDTDDASPTAHETYKEIIDALGQVAANRYLPADVIVMHPRRWSFIYGGLDGSNRPLLEPSAGIAQNPIGVGDAAGYGSVVGQIAGVPVVTDASIPTNLGSGTDEDRIIVARRDDLLLWEQGDGAPMSARIDQVTDAGASLGDATLTVRLVAFGYSAFTAGRYPAGISVIQGSLLNATL